jgi:hypothetical protein
MTLRRQFWGNRAGWPHDGPGDRIFLARIVDQIGQQLFGAAWTLEAMAVEHPNDLPYLRPRSGAPDDPEFTAAHLVEAACIAEAAGDWGGFPGDHHDQHEYARAWLAHWKHGEPLRAEPSGEEWRPLAWDSASGLRMIAAARSALRRQHAREWRLYRMRRRVMLELRRIAPRLSAYVVAASTHQFERIELVDIKTERQCDELLATCSLKIGDIRRDIWATLDVADAAASDRSAKAPQDTSEPPTDAQAAANQPTKPPRAGSRADGEAWLLARKEGREPWGVYDDDVRTLVSYGFDRDTARKMRIGKGRRRGRP